MAPRLRWSGGLPAPGVPDVHQVDAGLDLLEESSRTGCAGWRPSKSARGSFGEAAIALAGEAALASRSPGGAVCWLGRAQLRRLRAALDGAAAWGGVRISGGPWPGSRR